jgi:hypothetical protein
MQPTIVTECNMKMPASEMADRLSIAILKNQRTDNDMTDEINVYSSELSSYNVEEFIDKLVEINGKIWDLEADIRQGKEAELGLEEVGRRAIAIRGLNKIRVGYKNEMVEKFNEGFKDIKVNHGSE